MALASGGRIGQLSVGSACGHAQVGGRRAVLWRLGLAVPPVSGGCALWAPGGLAGVSGQHNMGASPASRVCCKARPWVQVAAGPVGVEGGGCGWFAGGRWWGLGCRVERWVGFGETAGYQIRVLPHQSPPPSLVCQCPNPLFPETHLGATPHSRVPPQPTRPLPASQPPPPPLSLRQLVELVGAPSQRPSGPS